MKPAGGTALTDEGRQAKLDELLANRFRQRGKLQLPSTSQYNAFADEAGLLEVAKDMCRWLGVKPNGLKVHYADNTQNFAYANNTITISRRYQSHPYVVGALLAQATVTYFIHRYDSESSDTSFIEYTTLYSGLGLWILNALRPKTSQLESLYNALDGRWFHNEGINLELYSPIQFASDLASFAHSNRIAPETYLPHVSPRSKHLLPSLIQAVSSRSLIEPDIVQEHRHDARALWIKICMLVAIFALATVAGTYYIAQRQPPTDPIQVQARESLDITKQSLDACIQKASDQQSTYDPNDIFMTRQIDATKSRCESLRNQYNHDLGAYRDAYTNK